MTNERAQRFGGPWSLLKVEAVEKYLRAYTIALSNQGFELIYIDAFAGSGSFTFGEELTLIPEDEATRIFAGSVKRALAVKAFKQLYFLENDDGNIAALHNLAANDNRVKIIRGDANVTLVKLCNQL